MGTALTPQTQDNTGSTGQEQQINQNTNTQTTTQGEAQTEKKTDQQETGTTEQGQQEQQTTSKTQEVPEKYEFKIPEGMELDTKALEAFSPIAKELRLTNEQAQKLVDLYAAQIKDINTQIINTRQAQLQEWETKSKSDQEFGGNKFNENLAIAIRALEKFGTKELRALLDETGLGSNPEVVRMFYRIGKTLIEDKLIEGTSQGREPKSLAEILYPKTK